MVHVVLLGPSGGNKTGIYVVAGVASVAMLVVIGGIIIGCSKYYPLFLIVKVLVGTDPDMTILGLRSLTLLINFFLSRYEVYHLQIFYWWLVRATYVVDGWFFCHFFWKVVGSVRIHVSHIQLPYTCSHVWRGHSRVGATRVWRGHSRVGVTHMWRGHSRVGATHVWRGHSRVGATRMWRGIHVWELLTCGGGIHVWELLACGGDIHVWELLTCVDGPPK